MAGKTQAKAGQGTLTTARKGAKKARATIPDLVVLAVVRERPTHGYEVDRVLQSRDVSDWAPISRPQVYYSLAKAAREGWVAPTKDHGPSEGPERDVYRLTRRGVEVLEQALEREDWANEREVPRFITWLALQHNGHKPAMRRVLEARRRFLKQELAKEEKTLDYLLSSPEVADGVAPVMVRFGIERFRLELRWLEAVDLFLAGRKREAG